MQVKVGSIWYRAEPGQPVMLYLEPQDRANIENMHPEATRYAAFHEDEPMNREERREWVEDRRPPIPQPRYEELVDELSEHARNTTLAAGITFGDHVLHPDDHEQGVMECLMGLMLGGVLDANQLLLQCEGADRDDEPQQGDDCTLSVDPESEPAQPQPERFTADYDSEGSERVQESARYRVTFCGDEAVVLNRGTLLSVRLNKGLGTLLQTAIDHYGIDRACSVYEDELRHDEQEAARYRRDERRRARRLLRDAGVDTRVLVSDGWS